MFVRSFKVKGEDVNDFMVMQNFAYLSLASKLIEVYLYEQGFSKLKLNTLKIGWQKINDTLINKKHLMFAEPFTVQLNFTDLIIDKKSTKASVDFYNSKNEFCAKLITDLQWFDYNTWKVISPPEKIAQYLIKQKELRRAV